MAKKQPATPRRRPKQQTIPGIDINVPEIDEAASEYVMFRDARMQNLEKETEAGEKLLMLLKDHKIKVYSYDGKTVSIEEVEKVRVRTKKAEKNGEAD